MNSNTISIISLAVAGLSLILAVCQWIYILHQNQTNFSVSIEKFEWYEHQNLNRSIFTFMIWNNSASPLIITKMAICDVNCLVSHQWIGDHYYPIFPETDIPSTERKLSVDFPICIPPNGGGMYPVIFDFQDKSFIPDQLISLTVQTSHQKKFFRVYRPEKGNQKLEF